MDEQREVEFPPAGTVVDLIAASRSETFLTWAVASSDRELLVLTPVDQQRRPVQVAVGERIDIIWRNASGLLCLPVVLAAVLAGERPAWRLRAAGVVKRGQRRDAVRAPITAPVRLGAEPFLYAGVTVDLSEGGFRCVLEGLGSLGAGFSSAARSTGPGVGEVVKVAVELPELTIHRLGEVARRHPRSDGRAELSVRFVGLTEPEADQIRRYVFARLRELRQRGLL
jgi:hypothetical protein